MFCKECCVLYSIVGDYKKANNKENWSPNSKRRYNHRVFTDSTEKAAVEQLTEQYINQQKACNNSDNNKNDVKKCLQESDSTIARIKQQYKLNTVRAQRKS